MPGGAEAWAWPAVSWATTQLPRLGCIPCPPCNPPADPILCAMHVVATALNALMGCHC